MRVQVWRERECARGHRDDFQGEHTHLRCIGVLLLWRRMYPQLRGTVVHMGSPRCLSVGFVCMELVRPPQLVLDHGTQALALGMVAYELTARGSGMATRARSMHGVRTVAVGTGCTHALVWALL